MIIYLVDITRLRQTYLVDITSRAIDNRLNWQVKNKYHMFGDVVDRASTVLDGDGDSDQDRDDNGHTPDGGEKWRWRQWRCSWIAIW